jgi:hypothetical protein
VERRSLEQVTRMRIRKISERTEQRKYQKEREMNKIQFKNQKEFEIKRFEEAANESERLNR